MIARWQGHVPSSDRLLPCTFGQWSVEWGLEKLGKGGTYDSPPRYL